MKKILAESLQEYRELNGLRINEEKNGKSVKIDQSKKKKYEDAISALKVELKKAKKPGAGVTLAAKNKKISDIETKISAYEKKLDAINEALNEGLFSNPVKLWEKIDKKNVEQVKKFAKGLVTGVNNDAVERGKKNIDSDKITLEMLVPALEEGAKKGFKNGTIRAGKSKDGTIMAKWVPTKMASTTAQNNMSGTGSS